MTLQKTDVGVGQTTAGTSRRSPEVFVPLKARDAEPGFWEWQDGFEEDPDMMTWPVKGDFRLRCEALRSLGNIGDILVMEKAGGTSFEYDVSVVSAGSAEYGTTLAKCDQTVRNSKKRFGYF